MLVVVLAAAAVALAYYYFTSTFSHWRDKGVKFVAPYPLLGSMSSVMLLREHLLEFHQRVYHEYSREPFVGMFRGLTPCLLVRDPDLIKQMLVKDFAHFTDHGFKFNDEVDPLEAKNLFNMEGQRWKEMRSKLTPTFTSGRMKAMFPLVQGCARQLEICLAALADKNEEFEVKDILGRYTTDVIGTCAFGIQCDSLKDPNCEFRVMGKKLIEHDAWQALKMMVIVFLPKLAAKLRLAFIDQELTKFFRGMVRDVMDLRKRTGETRKDFMQLLIELKEKGRLSPEDGDGAKTTTDIVDSAASDLTDDDVTAQATVFFLAGFETSSTVLSFALLELAVHQDVQQRARREIEEVIQKHDGQLTYQALLDMKYLDCVLKETMRKYPPLVGHMRVCTKNYIIPGTKVSIEEGTLLNIPTYSLQNDPRYFPQPERFDPERFMDDSLKNQFVYMPFGEGPRQCIGVRFAMMQSKLGLISVLRKFHVLSSPRTSYPVTFDTTQVILSSAHGVWIKLAPV